MDELEGKRESIYHHDTSIFAVNTAISSMNRRFTSRKAILTGFDLLNLECFQKTNEKQLCTLKKVAMNHRLEEMNTALSSIITVKLKRRAILSRHLEKTLI